MDRRTAMRQLAILTGGAALLPACDFSEESILDAYSNLNITASHEALIKKLTNTIFPGVHLVKAEEIQLEDFVLVMSNDCLNENQQQAFVKGLKKYNGFCKNHFDREFTSMGQKEAENAFIKSLEIEPGNGKEDVEAIHHFLATTKRFALQGYLNSEYFMTKIQPYELVPVRYIGSKKIEAS